MNPDVEFAHQVHVARSDGIREVEDALRYEWLFKENPLIEKLKLIILGLDEEGGVAVHQPDAFLVHLATGRPYGRRSPNPNDASVRMVCSTGQ